MAGDSRKVLYDYQARGAGEITIHEDEVVEIISEGKTAKLFIYTVFQKRNLLDTKYGEGWFLGKNSSGDYGFFPGNYVSLSTSLAQASVVEELVAKAKQSFGDLPSSDSTVDFQGMKIIVFSSYF